MALNKEQSYRIKHAERHAKGGADPLLINDLSGEPGANDRILTVTPAGDIISTDTDVLYITDTNLIAELENEDNWSEKLYTASGGLQGQRVVSTITCYFYECVEDKVWIRYPIAMSQFHMYLNNSAEDMVSRNILEDEASWIQAEFVGTLTNTYQGQAHYNRLYKYDAVADNIWIRTPRQ